MKKILLLVLVVFVTLELYSIWLMAGMVGWLVCIWFSLIISVIGFSLLRRTGLSANNGMPGLTSGKSQYLLSAILLIIPGYFSDILALLTLLPFVRRFVQTLALGMVARKFGFGPGMGGANNMAGMFGSKDFEDMMKAFGEMNGNDFNSGMKRGSANSRSAGSSLNDDTIIDCEETSEGFKAKKED